MEESHWQRIGNLFQGALDTPLPQREMWLTEKCGGDDKLRAEVARLLAHSGDAGEQLAAVLERARLALGDDAMPGQMGPYRLVRELGRGGMGSVWLAERVDGGFTQTVAIKFVKRGMDTGEILQRFGQERQILSLLNHPNIAHLLDGGATPGGHPYLVMEYVDGQPVVEYCRGQAVPRVLALFQTVCAAVQHAHSNLVIHRDLKPANILITARGEAKLLDFGIAKLLEPEARGVETRTAIRMFTPGFASPEQMAGQPCSTAADVFALGAVLRAMLGERTNADLAAITARATREEPALRYATVEQLSEDVRRHLEGRPVTARKGKFTYLAGKFLRRYRWGVAAAAAFIVLLAGSLALTLFQSRQIARERDRAEAVSRFLTGLFAAADPERNQGSRLTIRELLDDGLARARAIDNPALRQPLMETIGTAFFQLGLYEKSIPLHTELAAAYQADATAGASLARAQGYVAEAEAARGKREPAEEWAARAVATARGLRPADPATLALVLGHRCVQLHQAARFALAAEACREAHALAARANLAPASHVTILVGLGRALQDDNKLKEAEQAFQTAMPFASNAATEMNSASASVLSGLASLYYRQEKFAEAEAAMRRAIGFKRKLYPNGHLDLARSLNNLANMVSSQKRAEEAVAVFEEAHRYYRQALGPESSELASSLSNLAMNKSFLKQYGPAAALLEQVMAMQMRTAGAGQLPHINSQLKYASIVSEDLGDPARARPVLEAAIAALGRLQPSPPMQTGYGKLMLAYCLVETGEAAAGERLVRESEEALTAVLPKGHRWFLQIKMVRAGALLRQRRKEEARALLAPMVESEAQNADPAWRTLQARRYWAEVSGAPATGASRRK